MSIQNAVNIIVTEFIKASVNIRARAQENKSKLSPAEDFPFFGVKLKELDNSTAAFLQVPPGTFGVVVKNIARNSPADECGLQAWDIIAEIDGQLIQTIPDFRDILRKYRPLMTLELKIFRSGYEYHYRIKLGAPEKRSGRDWF
ncbi:MAG: PDZ domain-containing protein [FCB group bacterium]|nr:PDZ domain-containing protein [FCB group bacterium]